ncbi:MAG: cation:dicarboxylase symporter family transporter [Thiohalocapsa sp.]
MKFAPLGVFALVAETVATTGLEVFVPQAKFFFTVVIALGIHLFVTLPLLLRFLGNLSPLRHYRAVSPAQLTAFSTASSSATLPITMGGNPGGSSLANGRGLTPVRGRASPRMALGPCAY